MPEGSKIRGPLHFPILSGKVLSRTYFLDGTGHVYWAPRRHFTHTVAGPYGLPTFWPPAGSPVVLPRCVRFLGSDSGTNLTALNPTCRAAGAEIDANEYPNVYTDANQELGFSVTFSGLSPILAYTIPISDDLDSGDYLATDVLWFIFPRVLGGAPPSFATSEALLPTIREVSARFPRYHIRCHVQFDPTVGAANLSAYTTFYGTTAPAGLTENIYSYGGVLSPSDFLPTNAAVVSRFTTFIRQHWGLPAPS